MNANAIAIQHLDRIIAEKEAQLADPERMAGLNEKTFRDNLRSLCAARAYLKTYGDE